MGIRISPRLPAVALAAFAAAVAAFAQQPARPLTLAEALDLAARNNETGAIAQARLDRARALRQAAYSFLLPSLSATYTYTRDLHRQDPVDGSRNSFAGSAELDMTLLNLRSFPVARSFTRLLEAQANDSEELRRGLAFDVAQNFFAVLSAERLRDAARRRVQVAEAVVTDARTKLEAGLASQNELTRSELELATARLAVTQSQDSVRTTRLLLGFLMGAEKESDRPLEEPPPSGNPPPAPTEEALAIANRQDLKALELKAESARLLAREPWLRFVPAIGLQALYKGNNESFANTAPVRDWQWSATITWALFDGGLRFADAAARRAEFREATFNADALRRQIGLQIRTARTDLETAEAALSQAEVRSRVARQNEQEVRVRFGEGLATALEQADATASAFEADAELARQRFALRIAQLSLVRALGRWPGEQVPAPAAEAAPGGAHRKAAP